MGKQDFKDGLEKRIKKIVHGDMPDHFMSDNMLKKPNQILDETLALIKKHRPEKKAHTEKRNIHYRDGWNDALNDFSNSLGIDYD